MYDALHQQLKIIEAKVESMAKTVTILQKPKQFGGGKGVNIGG